MVKRFYNFPVTDSGYGITRFISSQTKIPNIHGEKLIKLSSDSIQNNNSITTPIGYIAGDNLWFETNNLEGNHWYQIDFLSFYPEIKGYFLSMSPQHFRKKWYLFAGDDENSLDIVHVGGFETMPEVSNCTCDLDTPVKARVFRILTNSTRFDDAWILALGSIEFFGKIQWPFCSTIHIHNNFSIMFHLLLISVFFT